MTAAAFQKIILDHYRKHGRKNLPFRTNRTPYRVLVSEIMLQQTQVERGIEKFNEFMNVFPDFESVAHAPLPKLLKVWQGLGYNRRALALQKCAQIVMEKFHGELPDSESELIDLPCIGPYTAGAIRVFAFNKPAVMIETNIRTVFLHFFFRNKKNVHDDDIRKLVEKMMYKRNPRMWYDALMDYGVKLKKELPNPSRNSRHYTKQSKFDGSLRQARGAVLKTLVNARQLSERQVITSVKLDPLRVKTALDQLVREGFVTRLNKRYIIQ